MKSGTLAVYAAASAGLLLLSGCIIVSEKVADDEVRIERQVRVIRTDAAPASPTAPKPQLLSAVGIGVSDLQKSADFYINVMGMKQTGSYQLSYMNEIVLGYPDGESYIVLMHWIDGSKRNYKDNPVKIVVRVPDPAALAARIKAAGFEVTREPQPSAQVGGAVVGFAKDPDGYVLELLPHRQPAPPVN